MSTCARPDCQIKAKSSCSGCGREHYCCGECQESDWKLHKSMCLILKKLSKTLQPYRATIEVINETLASKKRDNVRVLEHLLLYAEYQFGKRILGTALRERGGQQITHWDAEISCLYKISSRISEIYASTHSMTAKISYEMVYPCYIRQLSLLGPWLIHLDSDASNRIDKLTEDDMSYLLGELYVTELKMAKVARYANQFVVAEGHCERCLVYSKCFTEGKIKTTSIFRVLCILVDSREHQGDWFGGVRFAEEAYNLVIEAYDHFHPEALEAAGILISSLIKANNLFDAERYAEVTYMNLKDHKNGIGLEGVEVAEGAYNLADVIHKQNGDLSRAELLARESLRIRCRLPGNRTAMIGRSCTQLAKILTSQKNFGDETKQLMERSICLFISDEGLEGANVSSSNLNFAIFYRQLAVKQSTVDLKRKFLLLAKKYSEEGSRIAAKIYASNHSNYIYATWQLTTIISELSKV